MKIEIHNVEVFVEDLEKSLAVYEHSEGQKNAVGQRFAAMTQLTALIDLAEKAAGQEVRKRLKPIFHLVHALAVLKDGKSDEILKVADIRKGRPPNAAYGEALILRHAAALDILAETGIPLADAAAQIAAAGGHVFTADAIVKSRKAMRKILPGSDDLRRLRFDEARGAAKLHSPHDRQRAALALARATQQKRIAHTKGN